MGSGLDEATKTPGVINGLDIGHAIFSGLLTVIAVMYLPGVLL